MSRVWYASYGSNMCYERFLCYIQGGTFYMNLNKHYNGCNDKTPPIENRPIIIPYEMYFGRHRDSTSSSWGNYGVAFIDTNTQARIIGRAYLITENQYYDIWRQEGNSERWYDKEVDLGYCDGYPVRTFTNSNRLDDLAPSSDYLKVIEDGIKQMLGDIIVVPPASITDISNIAVE